jgi:hypothetical protein
LGKLLGSRDGIADLRTELLRVSDLLERDQTEPARLRLDRITAHLWEIRRDGTQFVLSLAEWDSIISAGTSTLQTAERTRAQPEIVATIRSVIEKLEVFGSGRVERPA